MILIRKSLCSFKEVKSDHKSGAASVTTYIARKTSKTIVNGVSPLFFRILFIRTSSVYSSFGPKRSRQYFETSVSGTARIVRYKPIADKIGYSARDAAASVCM